MKIHFTFAIGTLVIGWLIGYHTCAHDLGHVMNAMLGIHR